MPSLVGDRGLVLRMLGWNLTGIRNFSLVLHKKAEQWLCVEQSRELFSDIRGRGGASNACFHSGMSPSHRQAVKCAFIVVQSKLSISRVVTNMSLA